MKGYVIGLVLVTADQLIAGDVIDTIASTHLYRDYLVPVEYK
jgi:hypothetical protein